MCRVAVVAHHLVPVPAQPLGDARPHASESDESELHPLASCSALFPPSRVRAGSVEFLWIRNDELFTLIPTSVRLTLVSPGGANGPAEWLVGRPASVRRCSPRGDER